MEKTAHSEGRGGGLLRVLLQVVLTVSVTWFLLDRLGPDLDRLADLDVALGPVRWGSAAIASCLLLSGFLLSGLLWRGMVIEMGGAPIGRFVAIRIFLVANLGRYVPGKVLQLVGLTALAARHGVAPGIAAAAAVTGHLLSLLGATTVGLLALFLGGPEMQRWGVIGLGVVLIALIAGSLPGASDRLARLYSKLRPERSRETIRFPGKGSFVARWTLLFAFAWVVFACAFWLFVSSLVGPRPLLAVGPAFAAAYVGGYVALFAPAGLGVRESLLATFLVTVVSPEQALAIAVAARLWTTVVEVAPAAALAPRALLSEGR